MTKNREYSDISLSFEKNPLTGDIIKVKNDISIKQSLKTLVLTHINERPFQEGKGTRINRLLFGLKNSQNNFEDFIRADIQRVIVSNEPRVNLTGIDFDFNEDNNSMNITIFFTILNSLDVQTVDLSISRIR